MRRLLVEGRGLIVSDSSILRALFPGLLYELRDEPKRLLESSITSRRGVLVRPGRLDPDLSSLDAMRSILSLESRCLVNEELNAILTPWDLTVKLWLATQGTLAGRTLNRL